MICMKSGPFVKIESGDITLEFILYLDHENYQVTFSLGCLINFIIHQLNGESWYHQELQQNRGKQIMS